MELCTYFLIGLFHFGFYIDISALGKEPMIFPDYLFPSFDYLHVTEQ